MRTFRCAFAPFLLLLACDDKSPPVSAPSASASTPVASVSTSTTPPSSAVAIASEAPAPKPPPETIAAQHVLIAYKGAKDAPKTVTRTKAEARARAAEVAEKARAPGADFTALVAEYSDDLGTRDRMGSLGKFRREKMVKPFADAAFALEVDRTSDPVETPFGYHVIKRNQ